MKADSRRDRSLYSCLSERKILTKTNVVMLELFVDQWKCSPLQAILDTRILTETDLANSLATIFQVDRLYSLKSHRIDENSIKLMSYQEAKDRVTVLLLEESGRYDLVVADPSDQKYLELLKKRSPVPFTLAVGERTEIGRTIDEKYPLTEQLPLLVGDRSGSEKSSP